MIIQEQSKKQLQEVRTRNTSRDSSPGELVRAKSMNLQLRRAESDIVTTFTRKQQSAGPSHVSRTISSRPHVYHQDYHHQQQKSEVSKSKSVEASGRFPGRDLRMSSVPMGSEETGWSGIEMGCLSNYGISQPPPPHVSPAWNSVSKFGSMMHQPPPGSSSHRKLERQLTINPSFDPRINKHDKLSPNLSHHQPLLTSEAIDYMHRNPPPPIGLLNISEQSELSHQNVTRNASAPDSIKHWSRDQQHSAGPITAQHLSSIDQSQSSIASPGEQCSPVQRPSSGSDTQLDRVLSNVNRTFSADPFTTSETWKYNKFDTSSMSPLITPSIWSAPSPVSGHDPSLSSPPVSPARNLGPVGSRPGSSEGVVSSDRLQQYRHLCNIFPEDQVAEVMKLMPHENNTRRISAKIIELFPPN